MHLLLNSLEGNPLILILLAKSLPFILSSGERFFLEILVLSLQLAPSFLSRALHAHLPLFSRATAYEASSSFISLPSHLWHPNLHFSFQSRWLLYIVCSIPFLHDKAKLVDLHGLDRGGGESLRPENWPHSVVESLKKAYYSAFFHNQEKWLLHLWFKWIGSWYDGDKWPKSKGRNYGLVVRWGSSSIFT